MTARIAVTALGVACIVATAPSHPQPECCGEGYALTAGAGLQVGGILFRRQVAHRLLSLSLR